MYLTYLTYLYLLASEERKAWAHFAQTGIRTRAGGSCSDGTPLATDDVGIQLPINVGLIPIDNDDPNYPPVDRGAPVSSLSAVAPGSPSTKLTALPPVDTVAVLHSASPVAPPVLLSPNAAEEQPGELLLDLLSSDEAADNPFLDPPHAVGLLPPHNTSSPPRFKRINNQLNAPTLETEFDFENYPFDNFSAFGMGGAELDAGVDSAIFLQEDPFQLLPPTRVPGSPMLVAMDHVANMAPSITSDFEASSISSDNVLTSPPPAHFLNATPAVPVAPASDPALGGDPSAGDVAGDEVPPSVTMLAVNARTAKKVGLGRKSTGVGKKVAPGKKMAAGGTKATVNARRVLEGHSINIGPLIEGEQVSPPDKTTIATTRSQRSSKRPAPADEGCTWVPKATKKKMRRN